jgi:hypothetical protein
MQGNKVNGVTDMDFAIMIKRLFRYMRTKFENQPGGIIVFSTFLPSSFPTSIFWRMPHGSRSECWQPVAGKLTKPSCKGMGKSTSERVDDLDAPFRLRISSLGFAWDNFLELNNKRHRQPKQHVPCSKYPSLPAQSTACSNHPPSSFP